MNFHGMAKVVPHSFLFSCLLVQNQVSEIMYDYNTAIEWPVSISLQRQNTKVTERPDNK